MATPPPALPPLNHLQTQPSMADLLEGPIGSILLDPATPRTPKHLQAEQTFTTGGTAQCLHKHMDAGGVGGWGGGGVSSLVLSFRFPCFGQPCLE